MKVIECKPGPDGEQRFYIKCPACNDTHKGKMSGIHGLNNTWTYNGDTYKPTFHPSLLVTYNTPNKKHVCHSFVKDGMIQFLSDCTHSMAGQTVELMDVNENFE